MGSPKSEMKEVVLITGASRGIGLGLVKEFVSKGYEVIATCRNPDSAVDLSKVLEDAKQQPAVTLDVTDDVIRKEMLDVFNTNVAGVARVTEACGVLSESGGKVINISSSMGSVATTLNTGSYYATSYRCSKAALNMLTSCFSLKFPNTYFAMVHPGWVQTDMGGSGGRTADISVQESARGVFTVFQTLDK